MKAVLLKGYGDVDQLEYGDAEKPKPGAGEVLVKVVATSVNPVDWKIRQGAVKERMPLDLPAILGRDVAGEIAEVGEGVTKLKVGDRVMGLVNHAYAQFLVAKTEELAIIPEGMKTENAAALPLVLLTGAQLMELGAKPKPDDVVLVTGAVGSVGRTAVFVAKQHGAKVIAGVREKQKPEAEKLGVERTIAIDSDHEIATLGQVDAIADTVDHEVIGKLIPHLRNGGNLGSVLGKPQAAEGKDIQVNAIQAKPDAAQLRQLAEAVQRGELMIPITERYPLSQVREAQQRAEKGANGKVLLLP